MKENKFCIDCGAEITNNSPLSVRCTPCQKEHRRKRNNANRCKKHIRKLRFCLGCGKDISKLPNRAIRCPYCALAYNNHYVKLWKRKNIPRTTPNERLCSRCGKDISDLNYQAEICKDCRIWNKKRVDRDYYWKHKAEMNRKAKQYYLDNKESILEYYKKKRRFDRFKANIEGKEE